MNPRYASILALAFFIGIGLFQIFRGLRSVRLRNESSILGWIRVGFGSLLVVAPPILYFLYRRYFGT